MTRFPHEAGVIEFIPDSLTNLPDPPKFLIRTASPRDRQRVNRLVYEEGLQQHSVAAMREEVLRGLKANWSEDIFAEQEGRIRGFWDALDQYQEEAKGIADPPPFEHPDRKAMDDLIDEVRKNWRPLRVIIADIAAFNTAFPSVVSSVLIKGWRNLDTPYRREQDVVPMETMLAVSEALDVIETEHRGKVDGVGESGLAFAQLTAKCAGMMYLTEDEEKNSESPSPSSAAPRTSKKDGKAMEDGSSAEKSSTETPAI